MQPPEPEAEPPGAARDALSTLGEDLLLLSIRPDNGKIATAQRIDYGLMGSELVRLAATGRAEIAGDRIVVRDQAPTGDAELDAALVSIVGARRPPRTETWVGLPRRGIRDAYLARLISAGVLRAEPSAILGLRRYRIAVPERAAEARSRLDAIAQSGGQSGAQSGGPSSVQSGGQQLDEGQTAFGGLAGAIDLGSVLYPGRGGRPRRARLAQIARGETMRAALAAGTGSTRAAAAAVDRAADPAAQAAVDRAADPAGQAAVHAAISAATSAAVHAATSAAINGAQSAGGNVSDGRGGGLLGFGGHGGDHG
jgi:Golgi phosphoprotein 3 (GPP34)